VGSVTAPAAQAATWTKLSVPFTGQFAVYGRDHLVCGCVTNCVTITAYGGGLPWILRDASAGQYGRSPLVRALLLLLWNAPMSTRVRLLLRRGHCAPRGGGVKDLTAAVRSALPGRFRDDPVA
jgi:hypothetical protein